MIFGGFLMILDDSWRILDGFFESFTLLDV